LTTPGRVRQSASSLSIPLSTPIPLDRARRKAFLHLLPLVFVCYVVAYVDRANVSIAKLAMAKTLPAFDDAVIGFGSGLFFAGYFLLEIPGSVIVEKWSARKWICRIMLTWGLMAALTALVKTPGQFYVVRFFLGLAEAGFFPGVIIYLTHWFPARDRTKALGYFIVAQPVAQIISPKISNALMNLDALGLTGWQWLYIVWGVPALVLGCVVWFTLPDRPHDARWLTDEERDALTSAIEQEKATAASKQRMTLIDALGSPKVLALAAAYFCAVSASLGFELFMPSMLKDWYQLELNKITWLVILPPLLALAGVLFVGWNSDRVKERQLHATVPVALSLVALAAAPLTRGNLVLTMICFMTVAAGLKMYQPAFWAFPSIFLSGTAAAGSIGLINSIGNLGAFYGQSLVGKMEAATGSFVGGIYWLCGSLAVYLIIIFALGLGRRGKPKPSDSD
jgi:ACS family tartrate transporter-like MFS transporter